jgi:hypothetical protein
MMTCLISVRETAVEDGNLYHKDIPKIWHNYDPSLYEWILNLTEEFDLTFPLKNGHLSLVPCLLSDQAPKFDWPDISESNSLRKKELKVLYLFSYLPAGLFNRLQVRLYQYADGSTIWKNGSLLKKNEHIALIIQDKDQVIEIKVQGSKPENIIYVIHEVLEVLINESFNGIEYDCSFPCLDCVDAHVADPHMFRVSLIKRAIVLKAPFLQCSKSFHLISIPELQKFIPINVDSEALEFESSMSQQLVTFNEFLDTENLEDNSPDVFISYCWMNSHDAVSKGTKKSSTGLGWLDPRNLKKTFESHGMSVWLDISDSSNSSNLFNEITKGLNKASVFVACLSDEYVNSKNCVLEFRFAHCSLKKPIVKALVGTGSNWRNHEISFLGGVYPEVNCQFENTGLFNIQLYSRYHF